MSTSFNSNTSNPTTIEPQSAVVRTRFMLERKLGAGGMGTVWLARDTSLQRWVALKSIRPDLCGNASFRRRLERECLLHAKVGAHAHIVTLYDKIEDAGEMHLVMEYVEGETLQHRLEECAANNTSIPWAEAATIVAQSLSALARIHEHGIVHRDIKPANIILAREPDGSICAKLMDFGIARNEEAHQQLTQLTSSGSVSPGTPLYMSPEQIDSRTYGEVTERSDIYAMGIVFYQCLSGHVPFGGTLTEVLNGHLNSAPPPLKLPSGSHLPKELAAAANRAMSKRPEKRYASALEFRQDIERVVSGKASQAETLVGSTPRFPTGAVKTHTGSHGYSKALWVGGFAGALAGVVVIAGLAYALLQGEAKSAATASPANTGASAAPLAGQQRTWTETETTAALPNGPGAQPDVAPQDSLAVEPDGDALAEESGPLFADPLFEGPGGAVEDGAESAPAPAEGEPDIALGSLMVVEPGDEAAMEGRTHVVQRGESMSKIAQNYGLDWIELSKWNEMEDPTLLAVGQTLYLYKREGIREVTVRVAAPKPKVEPAPEPVVEAAAPAPPVTPVVETPPPAEEEKPGLLKRIFRRKKTEDDGE